MAIIGIAGDNRYFYDYPGSAVRTDAGGETERLEVTGLNRPKVQQILSDFLAGTAGIFPPLFRDTTSCFRKERNMFNTALIGAGYIAQNHIDAFAQLPNAQISALICRSRERGEGAARRIGPHCRWYPSLEEALAGRALQIVDICTPSDLHERYTLEAAQAGCHVLCEKPAALTVESFDRMTAACRDGGVRLMIAQVLRWWPEYRAAAGWIKQGRLGRLHMLSLKRLSQHPAWSNWHRDPNRSGGALFDLAIHDYDFLYSLFGLPRQVHAVGWKSPSGCWNHIAAVFAWDSGVRAVCETSMEMPGPFPFSVECRAAGDGGALAYQSGSSKNLHEFSARDSLLWYPCGAQEPSVLPVPQTDMFQEEIAAFLTALEDGTPLPVPPEQSREVLQLACAVRRSLESGVSVPL